MNECYIIHPDSNGGAAVILSRADLIAEAERQRAEGMRPCYAYNLGHGQTTRPGYLVYSTWRDGCAVCVLDGYTAPHIVTGWQGDFVFVLDDPEGVSA